MASTSFRRHKETSSVNLERQQDDIDDNDSSDWLDSTAEVASTPPNPLQRRSTGAKTERDGRYSQINGNNSPKKIIKYREFDDDGGDEDSPPGGGTFQRANNDNAAIQQLNERQPRSGQHADQQSLKMAARLRAGVDGNRHDPGDGRVPGNNRRDDEDDDDDDDDYDDDDDDVGMHYWSQARPTGNDDVTETRNKDVAELPSNDGLTFYGKPVFGSATEFELWKSRTDHGGGMPYRNGAAEPWLSSLRRPVNYTEIGRHDAKQQRLQRKWKDRVAWKSYTELQNEKNGTAVPGTVRTGPVDETVNNNVMNGTLVYHYSHLVYWIHSKSASTPIIEILTEIISAGGNTVWYYFILELNVQIASCR